MELSHNQVQSLWPISDTDIILYTYFFNANILNSIIGIHVAFTSLKMNICPNPALTGVTNEEFWMKSDSVNVMLLLFTLKQSLFHTKTDL